MAYKNVSRNIKVLVLLILVFSTTTSSSSSGLIKQACSTSGAETKICIQVLQSEPPVRSATNFLDLCASIIDSGIANLTRVHAHILDLLKHHKIKEHPDMTRALKTCESGYADTIDSFSSAAAEMWDPIDQYGTASYDLFASGDGIEMCKNAVLDCKIRDKILLSGNIVAWVYRLSASHVLDDILSN